MAHFAELDSNNVVIRIVVIADEHEEHGEQWCSEFFGGGVWKKTSYNTHKGRHLNGGVPYRKNYATIGGTYDSSLDAFIPPKPFDSWVLNNETCDWVAPIPIPDQNGIYEWNETNQKWESTLPANNQIQITEL